MTILTSAGALHLCMEFIAYLHTFVEFGLLANWQNRSIIRRVMPVFRVACFACSLAKRRELIEWNLLQWQCHCIELGSEEGGNRLEQANVLKSTKIAIAILKHRPQKGKAPRNSRKSPKTPPVRDLATDQRTNALSARQKCDFRVSLGFPLGAWLFPTKGSPALQRVDWKRSQTVENGPKTCWNRRASRKVAKPNAWIPTGSRWAGPKSGRGGARRAAPG
jgi:hypothetical protein